MATDLIADIEARVADFIGSQCLVAAPGRILAGFSGGADSTALVLVLDSLGWDVEAVHLNHGIRGSDAECDAQWCREFCARRGIRFSCHRLDVPSRRRAGESVETTARYGD